MSASVQFNGIEPFLIRVTEIQVYRSLMSHKYTAVIVLAILQLLLIIFYLLAIRIAMTVPETVTAKCFFDLSSYWKNILIFIVCNWHKLTDTVGIGKVPIQIKKL